MEVQDEVVETAKDEKKDEVYKFSVSRIKKKINDFIINNYTDIFAHKVDVSIPLDYQNLNVTEEDFLSNPRLLEMAKTELMFSEDQSKTPRDLLLECLTELESKGFLSLSGSTVKQYQLQIRNKRKQLNAFIQQVLQENKTRGVHFETIYKVVC